jgi:hypothetical protein
VSYGPDSLKSSFKADSCAIQLGLPTCGEWIPDPFAFIKFLSHELPDILGGWVLIGIVGASMTSSNGVLLAAGAVVSHNICRQVNHLIPNFINDQNLLFACRMATLPCVIIAAWIATFKSEQTSSLLILAFDISLASIVVPLIGCFYAKNPSPRAAIVAIAAGVSTRILFELVFPKDGYLIFSLPGDSFLRVGPAASALYPNFIDVEPSLIWNPEEQPCDQTRYDDWTGVTSLSAALAALLGFCVVQTIENVVLKKALFAFRGGSGYDKENQLAQKDEHSQSDEDSQWIDGEHSLPARKAAKSGANEELTKTDEGECMISFSESESSD